MKIMDVTIVSTMGLHARPATVFVKQANAFQSDITIEANGKKASGKSILGVLSLGAGYGAPLRICASGPDEEDAMAALTAVIHAGDQA